MSHQTSVCSPSVVVLFCLAASSLTSSAHVSLVFLIVSPNHPTWAVPLRYSFLILTSQISLSSCNPLLAAIYQSQVNPDTRLHPPPPCLHFCLHHCLLLIRTHVFGFASTDFYSSSLQRIPSLLHALFHLLWPFVSSSKSSFHLPDTHFSLFLSLITQSCC